MWASPPIVLLICFNVGLKTCLQQAYQSQNCMAIWSINSKKSLERKEKGKAQKFIMEDDCTRNP